jgi:hypothetical protein
MESSSKWMTVWHQRQLQYIAAHCPAAAITASLLSVLAYAPYQHQLRYCLLLSCLQFGTVDDVLAVYQHQQQLYGFASAGVQTTLIHALLKAHSKAQPGHLLAYEAWGRLKNSGKQLDAQSLLAGGYP